MNICSDNRPIKYTGKIAINIWYMRQICETIFVKSFFFFLIEEIKSKIKEEESFFFLLSSWGEYLLCDCAIFNKFQFFIYPYKKWISFLPTKWFSHIKQRFSFQYMWIERKWNFCWIVRGMVWRNSKRKNSWYNFIINNRRYSINLNGHVT